MSRGVIHPVTGLWELFIVHAGPGQYVTRKAGEEKASLQSNQKVWKVGVCVCVGGGGF